MFTPNSTDHDSYLPPKTCRLLPSTYRPSKHTVVVNKGNIAKAAEGNAALRRLVQLHIKEYISAKNKNCKTSIVTRISEKVNTSAPDGIGFVKYHEDRWFECSEHGAHDIISARFRDCKPDAFKSSNKSKAAKRRDRKAISTSLPKQCSDINIAASVISATELELSTSTTSTDEDSLEPIPFDCQPDSTTFYGILFESLFKSKEETSCSIHQVIDLPPNHYI
jgi:hypothetical protein